MKAQASIEFLLCLLFLLASASIFVSSVGRQHEAFSSSVLLATESDQHAREGLAADGIAIFGRHISLAKNVTASEGAGFAQNATWTGGRLSVGVGEYEPI